MKPPKTAAGISEKVAPHAGAWIETDPAYRRGVQPPVAPHAGAWIETLPLRYLLFDLPGRPPRGGVD